MIPPFQSFLEDNRAVVYRLLLASVGPNDADDVFQETFLAALRAYPSLRDASNLRGWVLTIATRKAIDAARSRGRRPVAVGDVEDLAGPTHLGAVERDDDLWSSVRGLPERQRMAVAHRFVLDRSYADIAEAMDCSEETARANVHQGLKKLRERWLRATK
jgi:RNA polymerase sigma factor (sigma-70 family)